MLDGLHVESDLALAVRAVHLELVLDHVVRVGAVAVEEVGAFE